MEFQIKPDLQSRLSQMAAQRGYPVEMLIEEAVERLVDHHEWFVKQVDQGLAAADRNEFISHADVRKLIDSRYPG